MPTCRCVQVLSPISSIHALSLHDALPIFRVELGQSSRRARSGRRGRDRRRAHAAAARSEEHTSELQSPCNLVCRLLLEIKDNGIVMRLRMFLVLITFLKASHSISNLLTTE